MCFKNLVKKLIGGEQDSPSDWLPREALDLVGTDGGSELVIDLGYLELTEYPKVWLPEIPDTNSMDPNFDMGHTNILIAGRNGRDHKALLDSVGVGDICVFHGGVWKVIHRVIEIGYDDKGRYFRSKGDNNEKKDPMVWRDSNLTYISIGTIY